MHLQRAVDHLWTRPARPAARETMTCCVTCEPRGLRSRVRKSIYARSLEAATFPLKAEFMVIKFFEQRP